MTSKAPTRRQIAQKVLEAIPVLNSNTQGIDDLKTRVDAALPTYDIHRDVYVCGGCVAFRHLTRWQRLRWLVGR